MMTYNFDRLIDRRSSDSGKWNVYGPDVLPMWVADMDFASPQPITDALQARVSEGVFGYGTESRELREALVERMQRLYAWTIRPEDIVYLPGLVCGLNVVCRAVGERGDGAVINTPVYMPFLSAPVNQQRELSVGPLQSELRGWAAVLHGRFCGVRGGHPAQHPALHLVQSPQPGGTRLHARRAGIHG